MSRLDLLALGFVDIQEFRRQKRRNRLHGNGREPLLRSTGMRDQLFQPVQVHGRAKQRSIPVIKQVAACQVAPGGRILD